MSQDDNLTRDQLEAGWDTTNPIRVELSDDEQGHDLSHIVTELGAATHRGGWAEIGYPTAFANVLSILLPRDPAKATACREAVATWTANR